MIYMPPYGVLCPRCRSFSRSEEHEVECDPLKKWSTVYTKVNFDSSRHFVTASQAETNFAFRVSEKLQVPSHPESSAMLPQWFVDAWQCARWRWEGPLYDTPAEFPLRGPFELEPLLAEALRVRGDAEP